MYVSYILYNSDNQSLTKSWEHTSLYISSLPMDIQTKIIDLIVFRHGLFCPTCENQNSMMSGNKLKRYNSFKTSPSGVVSVDARLVAVTSLDTNTAGVKLVFIPLKLR